MRLIETDFCKDTGKHLTGDAGVISSQQWPMARPEGKDCEWVIEAGKKKYIKMAFMDLQLDTDCRHFFVDVRGKKII